MDKPLFTRVAVLGLGLIGSSLARALSKNKLAGHIAGFDKDEGALSFAMEKKLIQSHHAHAGQAAQNADLIIFAAPPSTFETLAKDIAPFVKKGAIIMDIASVKREAVAAIAPHVPAHAHFVPAHPIAGSEKTGPQAGSADLFFGKQVILTPQEADVMSEPVVRIRTLWKTIGSKVEYMPPDLHDRLYAYVSHLPQMVAFAMRKSVKGATVTKDETFARFTRLTHSDAGLWADICLANADYVSEALEEFIVFATQIKGELSEANESSNGDASIATTLFPKIIATCLIATVSLLQERTALHPAHYAGSGFSDMTAPALSDPESALAAISAHHRIIADMLESTTAALQEIRAALGAHDPKKLLKLLKG